MRAGASWVRGSPLPVHGVHTKPRQAWKGGDGNPEIDKIGHMIGGLV
jgi:hypothetical protein